MQIPANSTVSQDNLWPFNIGILTINLYTNAINNGDQVNGFVANGAT